MLLESESPRSYELARPRRILHVVQHLKAGGAETFVRALTAGLRSDDLDVRILSIYPHRLDAGELSALGVPVTSLERSGRRDLSIYPRLVGAVRAFDPDIVHAHLHAGKYAGRIGALLARVPHIVFTEHGDEAGGAIRDAINRVLHARTSRFVVFTEHQRRAFAARERVGLERITVIPNGVAQPPPADRDALRAELGLPADSFAAFVPARMDPQKNHRAALRAFARIFDDAPDARLVLAGTGTLEPALRAESAALGLGDRVVFLGFRDDAPRLMRAMDALLMPSVWEGMPLALGEAMHAGATVVTSPWEGYADFVRDGETGIVARGHADDDFAEALRRARDDAFRERLAANARAFAATAFALETSVARHRALYAELAAAR